MKDNKKPGIWSSIKSMFSSLFSFGRNKSEKELEEMIASDDFVVSPTKQIIKNFFSNKLGVTGLVAFILIFVTVFGVAATQDYNMYDYEPLLKNMAPGRNYLKVDSDLQGKNIVEISSGSSFSVALDDQGKVYFWGQNPSKRYKLDSILDKTKGKKIKHISAGTDHIIAVAEDNSIIGVGNRSFNQTELNIEVLDSKVQQQLRNKNIVKVGAAQEISVILTEDGFIHPWGSTMNSGLDSIPDEYQGHVKDFEIAPYSIILTLDNNSLAVIGNQSNEVAAIPAELKSGEVNVVDVKISGTSAIAVDDQGKMYTWGSGQKGMLTLPDFDSKVVSLTKTQATFNALTEKGTVYSWGADRYGLLDVPTKVQGSTKEIYSDMFQMYAVDGSNNVTSWGNKGFLLGSDDFGRDLAERLIQGGKISLTVGAVAMLISTILGVLVGLIAGYYGGRVDNILMRFAEIVSSFPFLPLAITLSSLMPTDMPDIQRIGMIMVIQGVLSWPGVARLVRGQILAEREKDFVLAARALGIKENKILIKHILPSVFNFIIVSMTLGYASSLLSEAGLSFLGFGVRVPAPSWGNMLTNVANTTVIEYYWWQWLLPALCVMLTALSVNLIGDALRDAMDPKSNQK